MTAGLWIPPYIGASWLRGSAIEEGYGWVPTDGYLNHPDYPDIYAVGDIGSHPWPKMGHSATVQARIAVRHWYGVNNHRPLPMPYRPELLWAMETGGGRGLFVQSDVFYGGTRDSPFRIFALGCQANPPKNLCVTAGGAPRDVLMAVPETAGYAPKGPGWPVGSAGSLG